MQTDRISVAFEMIRRYAVQRGWIPIGWRVFDVGPWHITVNGTEKTREHVPPYHARVEHRTIISIMLLSPFGGSVGGWQDAEGEFIAEMEDALSKHD